MAWIDYKKAYDMVSQRWIMNCLKMYKISHDEKLESLAEKKIQRGIFQGDTLSPLLFKTTMVPLNHILQKFTARYKPSKSQEKINHLMYMNDIKLFAKTEKNLKS